MPDYRSARAERPVFRNIVLSQLSETQFAFLSGQLVPVVLSANQQLSHPYTALEHVYFPEDGLISTMAVDSEGDSVEVFLTGREGFVGVAGVLDQAELAHTMVVQSAGNGYRLPTDVLHKLVRQDSQLLDTLFKHLYLRLASITQAALCNRVHTMEQRLSRWLLNASDRLETPVLELTQEGLAAMIGASRSTVTTVAQKLQETGVLQCSRGRIQITDPTGLREISCECYEVVRAAYDRVLPEPAFSGASRRRA